MIKSKIVITIDTEVGEGAKFVNQGFEKLILGKIDGQYYGIPKIVEILDSFNYKAEFFVDVYEHHFFGEDRYDKLCNYLNERGHGVQLHTHPSYAYDPNRANMYEYSLEEQVNIIKEGKYLIKKWIHENPIAHRAGSYGADNNTLIALKRNKIDIDASYYHSHPNCKINLPTINDPIYHSNVLEIPVTVVKQDLRLFRIPLPFKRTWAKIDINSMNEEQIKKWTLFLLNRCQYITLFLHSFSFINKDYPNYTQFNKDMDTIQKFTEILNFFDKNNIESISFKDILLETSRSTGNSDEF